MSPPPLFARNSEVTFNAANSEDFLNLNPRGCYTGMRTINRTSIFRLSQHISRLATGFKALLTHATDILDTSSHLSAFCDASLLRPQLLPVIRTAVTSYCDQDASWDGEMKVLVILPVQTPPTILCHVSALPARPSRPVAAQIVKTHRNDPEVKDSQWARERSQFVPVSAVNEYLLLSDEGLVTEGSSSNFFVVMDGAVHTAGSGVLVGTVLKVVEAICAQHGIPFVHRTPVFAERHLWQEAFIASTSRWVLPLRTIYCPDGTVVQPGRTEMGERLAQLVMDGAEREAESFM